MPLLSARALATVWKLTTGEKGLQPNLFWDLVMVTWSLHSVSHIIGCYLTISPYTVLLPRPMMVYRCSPSVLNMKKINYLCKIITTMSSSKTCILALIWFNTFIIFCLAKMTLVQKIWSWWLGKVIPILFGFWTPGLGLRT